MSYKDLVLDRDKIPVAIGSFKSATISGPESKPNDLYIYTICRKGEEEGKLNVYYTKKGTTLATNTGKNLPLSIEFAEHIKQFCEVKEVHYGTLYIKRITDEEYATLCEFLNDFGVNIEYNKNLPHGMQFKVSGTNGGYIIFNRYTNGSFQVQGSNALLKSWVIEGLTELLPYKDIIEAQLRSLEVEITTNQAIEALNHALPESYSFLGETLVTIISPSVSLIKIEIELNDYSVFLFPALRGLEGYIKKLFKEKGITVTSDGFGAYIDGTGVRAILNANARMLIANPKLIKAIEDSYNLYKKHRHGLFHVDGNIETTRIINDRQEADDVLTDIYKVIEETYLHFRS